jgi:uncharacterized membrane protein
MAFCASCGAPVEGRFCAKCGSAVSSAAPPVGAPSTGPPPVAAGTMADNVASALCYGFFFFTGILFLVLAPYNQNRLVRFHAFQSIFFSVAAIIITRGLGFVFGAFLGFWTMLILGQLIPLFFFVIWAYVIIYTYQGKMIVLPIVGQLARQQAGL